MHLQPVFAKCRTRGGGVAERIFETGLCLPSGSNLAAEDRLRVANLIREIAGCQPVTLDAPMPLHKAA